ncbi:HPr kinase/phosphorylase [Mangrovicoccus ximenensis]|uniref:HPr kinase/phosphorylase n=1 Tax=Mangrovicoccus ximenensis TaxID=1911570 RepID=UPI001F23D561|nr:serine kinase [Mangrovicoccus ximenensis]
MLIQGPSGSGKSALALQLMAFGAELVADDVTLLRIADGRVTASAPPSLPHAIECRGIGLIRARLADPAPVVLVVDMSVTETQRLPEPAHIRLLDHALPMLKKIESVHFPAGILQYVRGQGRLQE